MIAGRISLSKSFGGGSPEPLKWSKQTINGLATAPRIISPPRRVLTFSLKKTNKRVSATPGGRERAHRTDAAREGGPPGGRRGPTMSGPSPKPRGFTRGRGGQVALGWVRREEMARDAAAAAVATGLLPPGFQLLQIRLQIVPRRVICVVRAVRLEVVVEDKGGDVDLLGGDVSEQLLQPLHAVHLRLEPRRGERREEPRHDL